MDCTQNKKCRAPPVARTTSRVRCLAVATPGRPHTWPHQGGHWLTRRIDGNKRVKKKSAGGSGGGKRDNLNVAFQTTGDSYTVDLVRA